MGGGSMSYDTKAGARSQLVSLRFTPAQMEMIERVAEIEDRSVSNLIRRAVSLYLFETPERKAYARRRGEAA